MKSRPKYSVVIPVLNGMRTLPQLLNSLNAQLCAPGFEVIIVDNGSDDGIQDYLLDNPSFKLLSCPVRGRSRARNLGARAAQGEYLVFLDCDVILSQNWFHRLDSYIGQRCYDAVATKVIPYEHKGVLAAYRRCLSDWNTRGLGISYFKGPKVVPVINTAACVMRRSSFMRIGGFDETLLRNEDLDLSQRMFQRGLVFAGCSGAEAQVQFNSHRFLTSELTYLYRAWEIGYYSRTGFPAMPGNWVHFFCHCFVHERSLSLQVFAFLVLCASRVGWCMGLWRWRPFQRPLMNGGKKSMVFSFVFQGHFFKLKPKSSYLFVDEDVYLLRGLSAFSRKLDTTAARLVQRLLDGVEIDENAIGVLGLEDFDALH